MYMQYLRVYICCFKDVVTYIHFECHIDFIKGFYTQYGMYSGTK